MEGSLLQVFESLRDSDLSGKVLFRVSTKTRAISRDFDAEAPPVSPHAPPRRAFLASASVTVPLWSASREASGWSLGRGWRSFSPKGKPMPGFESTSGWAKKKGTLIFRPDEDCYPSLGVEPKAKPIPSSKGPSLGFLKTSGSLERRLGFFYCLQPSQQI